MLNDPRSVMSIAVMFWRMVWRAMARMPLLFATGLAAVLAIQLASRMAGFEPWRAPPTPLLLLLGGLASIGSTLVMAPTLIAMHRFVLLGEATKRAVWRITAGYWRFVGWQLLVNFLSLLPILLFASIGWKNWAVTGALTSVCFAVVVVFDFRVLLLFPAIAIGTPFAAWRNAWRDSRGHFWRLSGTTLLATLPFFVVSITGTLLLRFGYLGNWPGGPLLPSLGSALISVSQVCANAAVASRFFQIYANALAGPAGSAAPATS